MKEIKEGNKGLKHVYNATVFSMKGIKAAFKNEAAFRQELIGFAILFPASFYVADDFVSWAVLVIPLFTVFMIELLNSGLESLVDRVSTEFHELSGRAKDMGSAAVFVNLMLISVIWTVFLLDKYILDFF